MTVVCIALGCAKVQIIINYIQCQKAKRSLKKVGRKVSATESRKVAGMPFRMLVKIKVQRMAAARKMKVTKRV